MGTKYIPIYANIFIGIFERNTHLSFDQRKNQIISQIYCGQFWELTITNYAQSWWPHPAIPSSSLISTTQNLQYVSGTPQSKILLRTVVRINYNKLCPKLMTSSRHQVWFQLLKICNTFLGHHNKKFTFRNIFSNILLGRNPPLILSPRNVKTPSKPQTKHPVLASVAITIRIYHTGRF